MHNGPMGVPDPRANAAEKAVVEANKELTAIQFAQKARWEKANQAINFILLPVTGKDGATVRMDPDQTPESKRARAAAYDYLAAYFTTTTAFEDGIPVMAIPKIAREFVQA